MTFKKRLLLITTGYLLPHPVSHKLIADLITKIVQQAPAWQLQIVHHLHALAHALAFRPRELSNTL